MPIDNLSTKSKIIFRMKEDQTQLITARLEHLQFMMDGGKMTIFRHRSDMFLFALEAYNIARGLSSRYYRLQDDMDIRFFVRFRFDYWLQEIQHWIRQLCGAEYRVDDDDFFAEGRAKRLTIVVDKLFHYHEDRLPSDSKEGSMPLPYEEIIEPFRAIMNMKSADLVASFREALIEVHKYLLRLSTLPIDWPDESRRKALQLYLDDAKDKTHVQTEVNNYRYFCRMPDGIHTRGQFCYLKKRLLELCSHGEFTQLNLSKSDKQALLQKLGKIFALQEFSPSNDDIPCTAHPMADDELFAKFLYFVRLDCENHFPVLDEDKVSFHLTRKDVYLSEEQEQNIQALFALMDAMQEWFAPVLAKRRKDSDEDGELQERIDKVLSMVKHYNSHLSDLLAYKREVSELDTFFARLFSPELREDFATAQDDLLSLFEKDRNAIHLKPYIQTLRVAIDALGILKSNRAPGKQVYQSLKGEDVLGDTEENTVNTYYTKQDFKVNDKRWTNAIELLDAVKKEYLKLGTKAKRSV